MLLNLAFLRSSNTARCKVSTARAVSFRRASNASAFFTVSCFSSPTASAFFAVSCLLSMQQIFFPMPCSSVFVSTWSFFSELEQEMDVVLGSGLPKLLQALQAEGIISKCKPPDEDGGRLRRLQMALLKS
ncbi:hypothetical protein AK812_SmicGene12502 [Symbiodinium microadriaticum]|uniref:Uncharacterized protein n=1 Tax=Symbiodinium microadriaticum TaxID=2951 RepID=A0A1Q9EAI5_SYMMI|nr:hypothetical protein AK812_SmicGene12502 [Symbiodinium microadriaticum]CAE7321621.1 unnamed protein product [Symbiodinium sp. KB8]